MRRSEYITHSIPHWLTFFIVCTCCKSRWIWLFNITSVFRRTFERYVPGRNKIYSEGKWSEKLQNRYKLQIWRNMPILQIEDRRLRLTGEGNPSGGDGTNPLLGQEWGHTGCQYSQADQVTHQNLVPWDLGDRFEWKVGTYGLRDSSNIRQDDSTCVLRGEFHSELFILGIATVPRGAQMF